MAMSAKKPKPKGSGFPKKEVAATRAMGKKIDAERAAKKKAAPAKKKAAPKNIGYTAGAKGPKARVSNGLGESRQARDYNDLLSKKSPAEIKGFKFGRRTN